LACVFRPDHSTSPSEGETVLQLSDVVCAVINNPQFVDAIIPMVLDKVLEAMKPVFIGVLCSSAIFVYIHIKSFVYKVQITDNKSSGNIY
jgi:hypothetical protein